MKRSFTTTATLAIAAGALACPFCKKPQTGLFIGQTAVMGNGAARSWIDIGKDGRPTALGVTFGKTALSGLPASGYPGMAPEFLVHLPSQASITPFDHVAIDWEPNGHEPKGVYDKPHFDFHFYTVPTATRSLITLDGTNVAECCKAPAKGLIPSSYVMIPATAMKYMGVHWIDPGSPELNGRPFTSTMIYGTYGGRLAFVEPMISMEFLRSQTSFTAPVPRPEKVQRAGYYPTEYTVAYNAEREEYTVELTKFAYRQAPPTSRVAVR